MKTIADAYFAIGKAHAVCQDYARTGHVSGRLFAIVSDGCSSSPDTDFGARLLTMAAIRCLPDSLYQDQIAWYERESVGLHAPYGLSSRCLDATLLVVSEQEDGTLRATAFGDGVLVARRWDGVLETWEIDFHGAPGYISYLFDLSRLKQYLDEGYGERQVTHRVGGEVVDIVKSQIKVNVERGLLVLVDGMRWEHTFSKAEYDLVLWLSDGALSFQRKPEMEPIGLSEIVSCVTDIRVRTESFLVRSAKYFLTKTCGERGWQHTDDFGAAGILVRNRDESLHPGE